MAITFINSVLPVFDSTNPFDGADLAYPTTGISSGDIILVGYGACHPDAVLPSMSGFTLQIDQQLGGGTTGAGAGLRRLGVYSRIADGNENNTTLQVPAPTGGTVDIVATTMVIYRSGTGFFSTSFDYGQDTTGANLSVTKANPGTDRETAGDFMICFTVAPANANLGAQTVTATGATYGTATERTDAGNTGGDDIRISFLERPVSSGTATAATVYTSTTTNTTCGTAFIRLRESAAPTAPPFTNNRYMRTLSRR